MMINRYIKTLLVVAIAMVMGLTMMPVEKASADTYFKVPTISHEEETTQEQEPAVGETKSIYVSGLKTKTKASIRWKKVSDADGYYLYRKVGKVYKRVKTTKNLSVYFKNLTHTNYFAVRAYRKENGKTIRGEMHYEKVTMPSVITPSTKGYKNTNGYKVIKKAKSKYGARYVWGASGPNRFDCSGFTCWTMKNSGVSGTWIPRYSSRAMYSIYNGRYGIGRNLSKAQSGDILIIGYNGSAKRIFHVGIYDANGYYVHANGKKVTRSAVPRNMVVGIIRLKGLQ